MKTLILIRHCASSHAGERYIGRTDTPLTPAGQAHAHALRPRFQDIRGTVLTSPSRRTLETAGTLFAGTGLPIEEDPDLREIDFGRWENMTFQEIAARDPELVTEWTQGNFDFSFPEGESLADFRERIIRSGERMKALPDDVVMAVTHGGVIRFLLCHFLEIPFSSHFIFGLEPGGVARLSFHEGKGVLTGLDNTPMEVPHG